jgi:deoxyribodipyrimidine photolyase
MSNLSILWSRRNLRLGDLPEIEGTSRLSPYLKYGLIHPAS